MKPSEIVSLIERIEKSGNKTQALAEAGVNKATYYSWLRRYRRGGIAGLIPKQSKWTDKEIQKLVEAASEAWSVNDILPKFPKRSKKAIEAKLADCGFSFREHQRKLLAARKDKRCRKCGLLKPVEDFYDAAFESLDGKHSYCKQCVLTSQSKYRETNPEKIQSRQKSYRKKKKRSDPGFFRRQQASWRNTAKGAYATLQNRNKSKNRRGAAGFDISFDEFSEWYDSTAKECVYCGITLEDYLSVRSHLQGIAKKTKVLTIDRRDSNKPYRAGNLALACYLCNELKGYIFEEKEFQKIAKLYVAPFYDKLRRDTSS